MQHQLVINGWQPIEYVSPFNVRGIYNRALSAMYINGYVTITVNGSHSFSLDVCGDSMVFECRIKNAVIQSSINNLFKRDKVAQNQPPMGAS